jgi:hypothetical protein
VEDDGSGGGEEEVEGGCYEEVVSFNVGSWNSLTG